MRAERVYEKDANKISHSCLSHFSPKFREIRLATIVAIGLWKPYAKLESGTDKNLVKYDVY